MDSVQEHHKSESFKRKYIELTDSEIDEVVEPKTKKEKIDEIFIEYYKKEPRYCRHEKCMKQASFGPKNGRWLRCSTHKLPTDVNNRIRRCEDCDLAASFGPPDSNQVYRCVKHKKPDDTNKTNPRCIHPDCNKTASFGINKKKLTCYEHKKDDYINLRIGLIKDIYI